MDIQERFEALLSSIQASRLRQLQIALGFFGWFLVNGTLWFILHTGPVTALASTQPGEDYVHMANRTYGFLALNGLIVFPANIVALVVFAIFRRWIALGILSAMALNFAISIVLGAFINGFCLVPAFNR